MHRLVAYSLALAVLGLPILAHAQASTTTDIDRAFAEFVEQGDRARFADRTADAIVAYRKAYELRNEPRLLGLLGVLALEVGAPEEAAELLHRAFVDINKVPKAERWRIKDTYERARALVCRLVVNVSRVGADVSLDGDRKRTATSANQFYLFVKPGRHELRATLAGFQDAVVTIDAPKDETLRVELDLAPIPPPPLLPPPPPPPQPVTLESTAVTKPKETSLVKPSPWSIGAGVVALSGAISYLPATGVTAGGEWRFGEWFSIRADARAAWSPQYVTTRPLRGITFGGLLGACANRSKYFACAMMHVGGIGHSLETQNNPEIVWRSRFGLGPAAGFEVPFYRQFSARVGAELVLFSDNTEVRAGSYLFPVVVWSGPPVLGGFSVTLVWRPELRVLR